MLKSAPFHLEILPSAMMDIVRGKFFYESVEEGLGTVFSDYIMEEIENLAENAGVDVQRFGYYCRFANRFHQNVYYKMQESMVTVWRVLDQRFDPRRIETALR